MNTNQLEEMLCKPSFSFEVFPRSEDLGGGWNLKLYEDGEEVGGAVFPPYPPKRGVLVLFEGTDFDEAYQEAYAEGFDWQYQRL
mgnify:CR=1 FL=1